MAELSAANMPGVYSLLIDEDTTIASTSDSEEYVVHITQAAMAPVTRTIELYRRDTTSGQTITVANGCADADIERLQGSAIATPTVAGVLEVDVTHWIGVAAATPTVAGVPEVDITHIAGAAVNTSSAQIGVNVVNAGGTAWNSGAIGAATLAADTITAAKIAADAIGASELAADAVAEIADAVWDEDATAHQTQGTFGQAIGDPVADTNTIYKAVVTDAAGATVGADTTAIKSKTDQLTFTTANRVDSQVFGMEAGTVTAAAVATGAIDADALAADAVDEIWDEAVDGSTTARQSMRIQNSALAGKASGMATTTAVFRDLADSKDRITATVDSDGNRTAVTLDAT